MGTPGLAVKEMRQDSRVPDCTNHSLGEGRAAGPGLLEVGGVCIPPRESGIGQTGMLR